MNSNRLKTIAAIILVLAILLGIVGIGLGYYFYNQDNQDNEGIIEEPLSDIYCGCYTVLLDSDCDPENALTFEIKRTTSNCTNICTEESTDVYKTCPAVELDSEPICEDINITNQDGNPINLPLSPTSTIRIQAFFNKEISNGDLEYENFIFTTNSSDTEVSGNCEEDCESDSNYFKPYIDINLSDFQLADTFSFSAIGVVDDELKHDYTACSRSYSILKPTDLICKDVLIATSDFSNDSAQITGVEINTANIKDKSEYETISATFTIESNEDASQVQTVSILNQADTISNKITLNNEFISSPTNFISSDTLSSIPLTSDSDFNSYQVKTSLRLVEIGGLEKNITCPNKILKISESGIDTETEGQLDDNDQSEGVPTVGSHFSVQNTGPYCVERIAPENQAFITISIVNTGETTEIVRNIKNKLPRGFSYNSGSSKINGLTVADSNFVTISPVGESQQITWQTVDGWSLASNTNLTIEFTATAGDQAITGDNYNEVVIEPYNAPVDPGSIRASATIKVEQNCSAPETGIFDNSASKLILGIFVLLIGIVFYYTESSKKISRNIAYSEQLYETKNNFTDFKNKIKLSFLKITYPRKHFEKKIETKLSKPKKGR